MELRFIKGNWKYGKFKLQMKESDMEGWVDVPTVLSDPDDLGDLVKPEKSLNRCKHGVHGTDCYKCYPSEPKTMKKDYDLDDHCPQTGDMVKTPVSGEWPCEHIKKGINVGWNLKTDFTNTIPVPDHFDTCPVKGCHATRPPKPSLRDELAKKLRDYLGKQVKPGAIFSDDLADISLAFLKDHRGEL